MKKNHVSLNICIIHLILNIIWFIIMIIYSIELDKNGCTIFCKSGLSIIEGIFLLVIHNMMFFSTFGLGMIVYNELKKENSNEFLCAFLTVLTILTGICLIRTSTLMISFFE